MQVLEQILLEIEKNSIEQYGHQKIIDTDVVMKIIRSHMADAGWIPVEERLPEPGIYLVSCDDKNYPVKRMRMKGVCFYNHDGIYDGKVYAWRPLPEPYQPEKGDAAG